MTSTYRTSSLAASLRWVPSAVAILLIALPIQMTMATGTPYILFPSASAHTGNFGADPSSLCQTAAAAYNLASTGTNWALLGDTPQLTSWDTNKNVYSVTGVFMASANSFKNGALNKSLSDVGFCTGGTISFMTGLVASDWSTNANCSGWTSNDFNLDGPFGASCSSKVFGWIGSVALSCGSTRRHLCIHEGPTPTPTKSPTTSAPTNSPTTSAPSISPSAAPTGSPTSSAPTTSPTTSRPTGSPVTPPPTTVHPSKAPTLRPTDITAAGAGLDPITQGGAVGIGVGVGAGLLLLGLLVLVLFRRKNKRTAKRESAVANPKT